MMNSPFALKNEIKMLLRSNLLLDEDVRGLLLNAPNHQLERVATILRALNQKEDEILAKVLDKNPHFFAELNRSQQQAFLRQLMAQEMMERANEMESLEETLERELLALET